MSFFKNGGAICSLKKNRKFKKLPELIFVFILSYLFFCFSIDFDFGYPNQVM